MNGLAPALLLFAGSAVIVIASGVYLARYGDVLADRLGWGRIWVGTILVSMATSLPELVTNITVATRDQPDLAGGDILGSNMVNMLVLAMVALFFGGRRFFQQVAPEQVWLVLAALILTGLVVVLIAFPIGLDLVSVGLSSILILAAYLGAMRMVYVSLPIYQPAEHATDGLPSLRRAWTLFGLASLGVVVAAPLMAFSVEEIAETTGLATSFLGVIAVAVVTSMPEVSTSIAALRFGAPDLAFGNLYGSCAFNVLILALADPFYRKGVLVEALGREHVAAGLIAVLLMGMGLVQVLARDKAGVPVSNLGLGLTAPVYVAGVYLVFVLA